MAHVNTPEYSRGMAVIYNILKDGKPHSRAQIKAGLKKAKIDSNAFGRCRRLGRQGRKLKLFDVIITNDRDDAMKSTAQLVKGVQAKKSIAEKKERYADLAGSHKGKKSKAKSKAKTSTKSKSKTKKVSKKTAVKKASAKKPAKKAVLAGGGSDESASESANAS